MSKELAKEIIDSLKNHPEDWELYSGNELKHKIHKIKIYPDSSRVVHSLAYQIDSPDLGSFAKWKIKTLARLLIDKLYQQNSAKKMSDFKE